MNRRFALVALLLLSLVVGPSTGSTAADPAVAPAPAASEAIDVHSASEPLSAAGEETTGGPSSPALLPADATADRRASTLSRTLSLRLTPDTPGELEAEVSFDIPDELTDLTLTIQSNAEVVDTENFEQTGDQEFQWDGSGDSASVTFTYSANETQDIGRRSVESGTSASHAQAADAYSFVDTGDWALARVARLGTSWRWVGSTDVVLDKQVRVDGQGTSGGYMAYLGPMETHTRTVNGQEIRLVVPDAASLRESPTDILDSVASASEQFRVGERDDRVLLVAAPTTVEWSSSGLQYGDTDAWVVANARLDTANNVWIHEYVHTRQEFTVNRSGRWFVEGAADYYAALFTYEQGRIGFDEFREKLQRGSADPQGTAVLAEPSTWSNQANYLKGALVAGAVDREIRANTDGTTSLQTVIRRLNGRENGVDNADILSVVESEASTTTRSYADQYTTSSAVPSTWSRTTHQDLFGPTPAAFEYAVPTDGLTVSGPYRNGSIGQWLSGDDETVPLAVGERLDVSVTVENVGGDAGQYDTTFEVDGAVEDSASGELDPGESTRHEFDHRFDEPGTYRVAVADREIRVRVREPAEPQVAGLDAPAEVEVGEAFTVETEIDNEASWPAEGDVVMSLDGEPMLTEHVRLPPQSKLTYTGRVTVAEAGEHTIQVGDRSVTVEAVGTDERTGREDAATDGTDGGDSAGDGNNDGDEAGASPVPGFGVLAALTALLVLLAVGAFARR